MIHDMLPGASGYEWNQIEEQLSSDHTVYTLDLLGCGRSEKAGITYTNFVYVELISNFIKDVIKEKDRHYDQWIFWFLCSHDSTS